MKRVYIYLWFSLLALTLQAQVTSTPSIISKGYTGSVTLTYDPTIGQGKMATATECYSHIGLITSQSKDITDWKYIIYQSKWGTKEEPKWTATGGKWTYTIPNIYTFFGCPETEDIKAIVMVFHDGNGSSSKEGKSSTTANGDILVYIGKETKTDIWEGFTPAPVTTEARPKGIVDGIYYGADSTSVTLSTYVASKTAPAQHVFLLGDFTDWQLNNEYQLHQDGNYFWITLTGLEKGKEYRFQYAVIRDDGVKKQLSELYSEKLLHLDDSFEPRTVDSSLLSYPMSGAEGYVSVIQPGKPAYQWDKATTQFVRPDKNNLVVYEVWTYDFTPERSLQGVMQRLNYLKNLGVNCIELMPINEFDGNMNWGYSPNHYFALDKAYGTPNMLKQLVDSCHKKGIAVVLDMVFNHATGANPMQKLYPQTNDTASRSELRFNPWFNQSAPHPDNVYQDWNHDFEPAQRMFTRAVQYWLTEYKIDGYRFDLSHGLCGTSYNALTNIQRYYDAMQDVSPGAYLMLEHWGNYMTTDRPQLIAKGMTCWQNTSEAFQQTAMGWLNQNENDSFEDANQTGYVSYAENHDEERCAFKAKKWGNGNVSKNDSVRIMRTALNLGFQAMMAGPQLMYQFSELSYDNSKYQDADGKWGENPYGITPETKKKADEVKMETKARPEEMGWFRKGVRMKTYQRLAQIIQLRTRLYPTAFSGQPSQKSLSKGTALRYVQWGDKVYVVGNFSHSSNLACNLPSGTWYDYFQGGKAQSTYQLAPGEIRIFLDQPLVAPTDIPDEYDFSTDLQEISSSPTTTKATKYLQNGQIYILLNNQRYDIMGRKQ